MHWVRQMSVGVRTRRTTLHRTECIAEEATENNRSTDIHLWAYGPKWAYGVVVSMWRASLSTSIFSHVFSTNALRKQLINLQPGNASRKTLVKQLTILVIQGNIRNPVEEKQVLQGL